MATALTTIKNWFKTGLKPTQAQFWATWDSFRHKDDKIPTTDIQNLDTYLDQKVDKVNGYGLSERSFSQAEKDKLENLVSGDDIDISNKVDKIEGKGLSTEDFTTEEKAQVADNSLNKQLEVTDATGDLTLTDAHFRQTFFINGTVVRNITIPTGVLRDGFVCFFITIGTGQLNILTDGGGAMLLAPNGTLLSNGYRGMVEKKLTNDTFYASGEWEV
ncbi:conserved hypothetical protein, putative phage tail fiber protein [Formosa agariphila KMM 3901]|uniref:Uncharacterized protein n=1 Tax=Formosa agariphila (strain DSM 15362 / KCTC 12365 / LMG 23005 / KMM 3901 / M-2Alg 35-1) TaxID=1347342 RepID=T2KPX9_FORAG|nr:hypothetical protein [Formosa agariphila]CDF80558.1 conserved hypothetical protein, putative phage tail fiber protein [Formosa agariphila KMM 3901]